MQKNGYKALSLIVFHNALGVFFVLALSLGKEIFFATILVSSNSEIKFL